MFSTAFATSKTIVLRQQAWHASDTSTRWRAASLQALEALLRLFGVVIPQAGGEHAFPHPGGEAQRAVDYSAPPGIVGLIVTDDVLHGCPVAASSARGVADGSVYPTLGSAGFSTTIFRSGKTRRWRTRPVRGDG